MNNPFKRETPNEPAKSAAKERSVDETGGLPESHETQNPAPSSADASTEFAVADPLDGDVCAGLRADLAAEQDRVLRVRAEMENLRSRTARELADQIKFAALPLARDLIPAIDNLDRAIESASREAELSTLIEGIGMVRGQLLDALARHHCVPIEADGEPFDPQFHEAILQQHSAQCPAQHVLHVAQTGYRMHDRVVRAAQVIVSSGPEAATGA